MDQNTGNEMPDFWEQRLDDAWLWCFVLNLFNTVFQSRSLMAPKSNKHLTMNIIYMSASSVIWALMFLAKSNRYKKH